MSTQRLDLDQAVVSRYNTTASSTTTHDANGDGTSSPAASTGISKHTDVTKIVGLVLGVVVLLAIAALGLYLFRRRRTRPMKMDAEVLYTNRPAERNVAAGYAPVQTTHEAVISYLPDSHEYVSTKINHITSFANDFSVILRLMMFQMMLDLHPELEQPLVPLRHQSYPTHENQKDRLIPVIPIHFIIAWTVHELSSHS